MLDEVAPSQKSQPAKATTPVRSHEVKLFNAVAEEPFVTRLLFVQFFQMEAVSFGIRRRERVMPEGSRAPSIPGVRRCRKGNKSSGTRML